MRPHAARDATKPSGVFDPIRDQGEPRIGAGLAQRQRGQEADAAIEGVTLAHDNEGWQARDQHAGAIKWKSLRGF
jgi:hypothetical protein